MTIDEIQAYGKSILNTYVVTNASLYSKNEINLSDF